MNDLVAQFCRDLALQLFDLLGPEFGDRAGVDVDDVVVMGSVRNLIPRATVFQGEAKDDPLALEDREGAVDGGEREAVVEGAGPAVEFGRVGVILGVREDLEERLALAGHADPGVTQGLGRIGFHAGMVAGAAGGVKPSRLTTGVGIGFPFHSNLLGVRVRVASRFA